MRDRAHRLRVYPRVGGETAKAADIHVKIGGLSPRGRGNHFWQSPSRTRFGSIPAWAGKPASLFRPLSRLWVYPRVGGETSKYSENSQWFRGLSPRGRGNHIDVVLEGTIWGSIPAWAGKPSSTIMPACYHGVYPRVGGETLHHHDLQTMYDGLSPRGRGNRTTHHACQARGWSIPAWAGKPSACSSPSANQKVYPRVGGETSAERS